MSVASTPLDAQPGRRRLATMAEVRRDYLPLPQSSLYDLARAGKLPGTIRVGRRVLVDLNQLEACIQNGGART